jgi:hypothetical protein
MAGMTDEQRAAFEAGLRKSEKQQEMRSAVPTQRTRTAAQGLTLGFSDEIEARARSLTTGRTYEEVLDEIRGSIKAYQEARPSEALAYEVGGAALPAIGAMVAAPFTGGTSTAAVAPTLARMIGGGAAQGGIAAFGTGEGGAVERLSRIPGGATSGAVGGAISGGLVRAAGGGLSALTDATRRLVGNRGSSIVENEIQRLVKQTGRTADEISDDILNGRLLAENRSIQAAVRSYRSGGGEASRIIEQGLQPRPDMTRGAALDELNKYLADISTPSALQAQRRSEDVARIAEREAYSQFRDMPASDEVVSALADTLRRVPSAAEEVEVALRAQTGSAPFFKILEDGSVQFTRQPTVAEAESVRRAVGNRASALYKSNMGAAGEAVSEAETGFRGLLDQVVPELSATRATAAAVRSQRDAFKAGEKALSGDVNEQMMEFAKLTDPNQIEAYRAGLMAAIQARAATSSRQSMIRNMANENTKEGRVLREVLPQDAVEDVMRSIETATRSQEASGFILGGSATAETLMERGRQGLGLSVSDISGALSMDPTAITNVASKIANRFSRDLTDAERARIARILVSDNADLVRRAIQDDGALAVLRDKIERISATATRGASRAGAVTPAETSGDISGPAIRGLLAQ